ncbi:MAG: trehalose-phosphatase [Patescibacteria group bacterium]
MLFLLDYDHTLLDDEIEHAGVRQLITALTNNPKNIVVIISGRAHDVLDEKFHGLRCALSAEHGIWRKDPDQPWNLTQQIKLDWKDPVRQCFQAIVACTSDSLFEEKPYGFVWHNKKVSPDIRQNRMQQLVTSLTPYLTRYHLRIIIGHSLIELVPDSVNKGRATLYWLQRYPEKDILAAGDDTTDEDMFSVLPDNAITIRVGAGATKAKQRVPNPTALHTLLRQFV